MRFHARILSTPKPDCNRHGLSLDFALHQTCVMSSLGERVKQLRERAGLRAAELARLLGISQPALWAIETGDTKSLKATTLKRLCEELHTTADFILSGDSQEVGLALATMEAEILFLLRSLRPERRITLLEYARFLKAQQQPDATVETSQAASPVVALKPARKPKSSNN
jgi:transcriptional regulator with XRE-family HTH domain